MEIHIYISLKNSLLLPFKINLKMCVFFLHFWLILMLFSSLGAHITNILNNKDYNFKGQKHKIEN